MQFVAYNLRPALRFASVTGSGFGDGFISRRIVAFNDMRAAHRSRPLGFASEFAGTRPNETAAYATIRPNAMTITAPSAMNRAFIGLLQEFVQGRRPRRDRRSKV